MTRLGKRTPDKWLSGPDPIDNDLYIECQKRRAQAWFRGEEWAITEHEYIKLWRKEDRYLQKGRHSLDLCMSRIDTEKPWTIENIEIITRREHAQNCRRLQQGLGRIQRNQHERI